MKRIKLEIIKLNDSKSQQGAYALVLGEQNGARSLPIIIGAFEAQSIAIEIQKMKPVRPITHDLFKSFAEAYNITLKEVIIYNLVDGVFYARLICTNKENKETELDARTSDAVALAVRFSCPIYTYEFILTQAGIQSDLNDSIFLNDTNAVQDSEPVISSQKDKFSQYTLRELELKMNEALLNENYELAAFIRDEIQSRKKR